jgi:hypothetical protein
MTNSNDLGTLKTSWLHCLLVQVRDDTPDDIRRGVEQVIPICVKHRGTITDLMASIQLVAFGMLGGAREECRDDSRSAMEELRASLGGGVRIVAFEGDAAYGNVGTDRRMNYTILTPKFDRLLAALLDTDFGGVSELGAYP